MLGAIPSSKFTQPLAPTSPASSSHGRVNLHRSDRAAAAVASAAGGRSGGGRGRDGHLWREKRERARGEGDEEEQLVSLSEILGECGGLARSASAVSLSAAEVGGPTVVSSLDIC